MNYLSKIKPVLMALAVVGLSATDVLSQVLAEYTPLLTAINSSDNQDKPAGESGEVATSEEQPTDTESRLAALTKAQEETAERLDDLLDEKEKEEAKAKKAKEEAAKTKKWFEKYTIRGYGQFRFNEILDQEDGAAAHHVGDSSVGDSQSFLIRRARLIISGEANDHISIYLQPDFASTPNNSVDAIQFAQIRDWYTDIHFDKTKVYRVRAGQSKVPYGFENLQSSQNRLPLDRNDAFNSAVRNERDLGAFFYWTPEHEQELFKSLVDDGLKGSGNYGVFGIGVYNGQGGSLREQNDDLHLVSRIAVPHRWSNGQITEYGIQGYTGKYTVLSSTISPLGVGAAVRPTGTLETGNRDGIIDKRIGGTFVHYPQPLGFQAEWTVGRGPSLNEAQTQVIDRALYGGYLMSMYRKKTDCYGDLIPFVRWSYFKGGYKSERNAPFSEIDELELGLEWQFSKNLELVGMYTLTDRTNTQAISSNNVRSYESFTGELARFQLQFNY